MLKDKIFSPQSSKREIVSCTKTTIATPTSKSCLRSSSLRTSRTSKLLSNSPQISKTRLPLHTTRPQLSSTWTMGLKPWTTLLHRQTLWSMINMLKSISNHNSMTCRYRMSSLPPTTSTISRTNWDQSWEVKSNKRSEPSCTIKSRKRSSTKWDNRLSMKSRPKSLRESRMRSLRESRCKLSRRSSNSSKLRSKLFKPKFRKKRRISLSHRSLSSKGSS
jgi:hypothetical protein